MASMPFWASCYSAFSLGWRPTSAALLRAAPRSLDMVRPFLQGVYTAIDISFFLSIMTGNYNIFAYPSTFVYMLIPASAALGYSLILMCDPSPAYSAWKPSKTLVCSFGFITLTLFLAALLPCLPGADQMTTPDAAMLCTWRDYMSWRTIFNNPDLYPWINDMDTACNCLRAADAFAWILTITWSVTVAVYVRLLLLRRRLETTTKTVAMRDLSSPKNEEGSQKVAQE